jgi:class 3 adenylate cyclase
MSVMRTVLVAAEAGPEAAGVVAAHGGELLSNDRVVAAFDTPADAVRAAAALVDVADETAARVGVDAGEPAVAADVAERICDAAEPGQALVTEAVAHLAGRAVADLLRPAGAVRVAELRRTVPVFAAGPAPPGASDTRRTTVVVADDQALLRAGFRIIIDAEPDLRVVG